MALIYGSFFSLFGVHATLAFVLFSIAAVVVPAIAFGRALRARGLAVSTASGFAALLLICSWPAILVIDRGNMEICVWIALALAMWAYATGRGYLAASFFGVAAALKLFPFIFLTLFFSTRRFKELLAGVAVFFALSIARLAVLGPTIPIAAPGIADGLHYFAVAYMARWNSWENGVDHSLFATIKFVLIFVFHVSANHAFTRELSIYNALTVVGGVLLYFLRIRFLPLLNQILILSILSIYFTAFSGDGTLFHLYYPFAMLAFLAIDAKRRRVAVKGLGTAFNLLAFLVSYEGFFVHHNRRFEGEIKCLALTWLLLVAFRSAFGPPLSLAVADDNLAWPDARLIRRT